MALGNKVILIGRMIRLGPANDSAADRGTAAMLACGA